MKANEIIESLSKLRTLHERFAWCYKHGLSPVTRWMGKGGVFQVKEMNGITRVQISAGWGRYNYAWVVEIPKQYATDAQFNGFLHKYRRAVPSVRYNLYRWFTNKYLLTDNQKREL